jgi:hypothetical protein
MLSLKMKKQIIIFLLILLQVCVYAKEIDYRQVVFGNAYENIVEVDVNDFFTKFPKAKNVESYGQGPIAYTINRNSSYFMDNKYLVMWDDIDTDWCNMEYAKDINLHFRVFKEQYGKDIFYRMLVSFYELDDKTLLDWKNNYYEQELFYLVSENELFHIGSYTNKQRLAFQGGCIPEYHNVEVIQRNNKVIGIIAYFFYSKTLPMMEWEKTFSKHNGVFITLDNIKQLYSPSLEKINSARITLENQDDWSFNDITNLFFSDPLIDSKRPFMYTLQNAFDGNPATSYVEDYDNDLFQVSFYGEEKVEKIAIINGYASDMETYLKNNQIKSIEKYNSNGKNEKLSSNNLKYQIFEWNDKPGFKCSEVYPGERYKDTCLAEVNFYTPEKGWIFGNIDE